MVSKKKSSSSNPLDAHRKAARARELKKNREQREKTREVTLVKKDTRGLERDIRSLQEKKTRTNIEQEELGRLQSEVDRIKAAKEEYLAKHPDHRKFVYPREEEDLAEQASRAKATAHETLKRQQSQRDPRRSIYYDETFNPHGAPPPGMPYMEKTAKQWEAEQRKEFEGMVGDASGQVDEEEEEEEGSDKDSDEDDDDDEIMLPEGPPPLPLSGEHQVGVEEEEEDSSEDEDGIVMPKGPPPGPPTAPRAMQEGLPTGPSAMQQRPLPLPPSNFYRPPLPPSSSNQTNNISRGIPRPFPRQGGNLPSMPSQTWSAPPRPPPVSIPGPPPPRPPTVITSAPVLRDLKKEVTAFVPPALRKKQAALKAKAAKGGLPSAVNAAPADNASQQDSPNDDEAGEGLHDKVDLMSSLQPHFSKKTSSNTNDDYKNFLGQVDDLL